MNFIGFLCAFVAWWLNYYETALHAEGVHRGVDPIFG
jgi:hypothetical protein